LEGAPKKIDPSTIRVPPKRGEGYQTSKSRAMQSQELIAFLETNSMGKYCKLPQDIKAEIVAALGRTPGNNTNCSTILRELGVSLDDPDTLSLSGGGGSGETHSADNLIALLKADPKGKFCKLPQDTKNEIMAALKRTPGPNTNCSTILLELGVSGDDPDSLSLSGGGGSLLSVDDSGDTMSQASSPSLGTRHEPSPQTGGLLGSWFGRGQSANTSQYSDGDPPPGAFEDMRGPGDDDASEPVMKKSEVDRIIEWAKKAIDHIVNENRRLASTNASMQEHITQLEMRAAKPQQYVVNADGAIADLVQYLNHA